MRTFIMDHIELVILSAFLLVIGVVIAILIPLVQAEHDAWVAQCEQNNGHVVDNTNMSVGIGNAPNGQPVTTTSTTTTYYCLSDDGRIISIK